MRLLDSAAWYSIITSRLLVIWLSEIACGLWVQAFCSGLLQDMLSNRLNWLASGTRNWINCAIEFTLNVYRDPLQYFRTRTQIYHVGQVVRCRLVRHSFRDARNHLPSATQQIIYDNSKICLNDMCALKSSLIRVFMRMPAWFLTWWTSYKNMHDQLCEATHDVRFASTWAPPIPWCMPKLLSDD